MSLDFRWLFESVPGRYAILAPDLTILAATDSFVEVALVPRESLVGRNLFDVFPDNPDNPDADGVKNLRASLDRVRAGKVRDNMPAQRYDIQGPDGVFQERYWSPSNTPLLDEHGELRAIIHSAEEVTELMVMRTQAAQRDRAAADALTSGHEQLVEANNALAATNEELEAFCYSVAHDLRAPLRGIQGFSQALLEDYHGVVDQKGQNYLQRVASAALRMSELIDDLLNLSRISRSPLSRAHVDITALAREIASELSQHASHHVETVIGGGLQANADARLVRIVLENLIGNAFKFTAATPHARIVVGLSVEDGVPAFFVRDNGAGFDEAYASKLFAPFQRLHSEKEFTGTGIGLATVQRVVRRHGGRAWARAAVNSGATIYFTLPD